jgi:hypothetical protein
MEGKGINVVITFYFGVAIATKATIEVLSPFLLWQTFFFFVVTWKATTSRLSLPSILVLLQQRR